MVFFLEEVNTENDTTVKHEVHATKKARAELQRKHIKRGDIVEVVMFRHTYTIPTMSGEERTHTRHNLVTITKFEETNAKRKNAPANTDVEE